MLRSIIILRVESESAEARWCIEQYYRELAQRFEGGFDPSANAYAGDGKDEDRLTIFALARLDGEPAGCASLVISNGTTGEIKRMWVAPDARGLGIARRLLAYLEDAARQAGLSALRLDTNRVLTEAHALYRSAGFQEISRYSDNPYAHFWFGKEI